MEPQRHLQEAEFAFNRNLFDVAARAFGEAAKNAKALGDYSLAADGFRGLARACSKLRQFQKMAEAAEHAYTLDCDFWGPNSQQAGTDAVLVADAYSNIDNHERARDFYQKALLIRRLYVPDEHDSIIEILVGALMLAVRENNHAEMLSVEQALIPIYLRRDAGRNWLAFSGLDVYVQQLSDAGEKSRAGDIIVAQKKIFDEKFPDCQKERQALEAEWKRVLQQLRPTAAAAQPPVPPPAPQVAPDNSLVGGVKRAFEAGKMRGELPIFLEQFVSYVQAGVSWQQAITFVVDSPPFSCRNLCAELKPAVDEWRQTNKPLPKCLQEVAAKLALPELDEFACTLAAAQKSGGSVSASLIAQSQAIRDKLKSRAAEIRGALQAFHWRI